MWLDREGMPQTVDFSPDEHLNARLKIMARDLHKMGPCHPNDDPHDDLAAWVSDALPEWIAETQGSKALVGAPPPVSALAGLLRLGRRSGYPQIFDAVAPEWRLDVARLLDRYVY